MNKTVVIHQPDFVPYLGFFDRFLHADLYIALDHVQFVHSSRGWTHRDKIKTMYGEKWISLSVKKSPRDTQINKIELASPMDWVNRNLSLLHENYKNAEFYNDIMKEVEVIYKNPSGLMVDFNLKFIDLISKMLSVELPRVLSSTLSPCGAKTSMLIDLLKKVGATKYLSGTGALAYLDELAFHEAGIELEFQKFEHPIYPQLYSGFHSNLSSLDLLFNCGVERSRNILRNLV